MMGSSISIAKEEPVKLEVTDPQAMATTLAEGLIAGDMPKECTDVALDDVQKGQIKDAYFDFRKQKNTLDAEIKNGYMDLSKTMMSATSTKDEAAANVDTLKNSMMELGTAKADFELKVFYDILKPEQRSPAFKCIMKKMKMIAEAKLRKACKLLPPEEAVHN
ncbi:hypothetical protein D3C87_1511690 [compost metagenome]